ncbi:glycine betaine/L-proline ABC transporter ATP-binding protein [Aureimonas flava]|uniref:Quaternary amine transport ATP-binding protein n=1 Tax=Aureimonas flava TaxID=2320271 RepID=A0A3A1WRG2_9HYPH|nr:glycine betaine/L-proline ABC transporter ATP-binding protein [Aureimonas flava]RIY03663.1 glycine betaine/L-proline ABC transporter ATP-binding protein [Aureimonas flava]
MLDVASSFPPPATRDEQAPARHGIEIRNLSKVFGKNPDKIVPLLGQGVGKQELMEVHKHILGLNDINIRMPAGCIQVIMGLSGSGKSTLIRHINRLIDPTVGEVLVEGVDVCRMSPRELREFRRHKTAMVFQQFGLLPHRTVLDNAVYGLELQRVPRARQVDAAMHWLGRVGLAGFEGHYPHQLSGGMQQRVGLARALVNDAPILLMDEAFSALDPLIRVDMQSILLDLQKEIRKTIVFITHDLDEALRLGDRIAILRDGEVVQQGTGQEIVLSPADDYIMDFVRHVNRGKVIQLGALTGARAVPPDADGIELPASTLLETAVAALLGSGKSMILVTDGRGTVLGCLTLPDVVSAMVSP